MFLSGGYVGYTTIAMELPGQPICRHRPLVSVKVETTFLHGVAMLPDGWTSSPYRSRPLLRNVIDFRSPSSTLLSSTHIVLLLEENAVGPSLLGARKASSAPAASRTISLELPSTPMSHPNP